MCKKIAVLLFIYATTAQAGFFDDVLNKAKSVSEKAVKETVESVSGEDEKVPAPAQESTEALQQTAPQTAPKPHPDEAPSASSLQQQQSNDNWKKTSTFSDDSARAMTLFEAPSASPSVLDIPLKNIRLGMPLRIAHERLRVQGFEYIPQKRLYRKEVRNVNGEIRAYSEEEQRLLSRSGQGKGELLERYIIKLNTAPVSEEMLGELDAERQAWATEARQIKSQETAKKQVDENVRRRYDSRQDGMDRRQSARKKNSLQSRTYLTGQPVSLLTYIEYRQLYYGDQRFDYDAAKAQAERVFGPQNYTNRSSAYRRGAAYKTSPEYQLVYADALLVPAAQREALVQQGQSDAQYGMKQAMSHPCSSVMRNACVTGAAVQSAFPGNIEKQLEYARVKFAPYMIVNHDTSKGMKIIQEWVYLGAGDSIRERFAEEQERSAEPVAAPSF